jgi:hypothetical protein
LATAFDVWALGWAWMPPTLVPWPKVGFCLGFASILLECAFSVAHFGALSCVAL